MQKQFLVIVLLIVLFATWYLYSKNSSKAPQGVACTMEAKMCPDGSYVGRTGQNCEFAACPAQATFSGYKNGTYIIEGMKVNLVGGKSEIEAVPGSASKIVTQYFGNNAKGDLNSDGIPDLAFLLTQSGSGTFYYVVVALQNSSGNYVGTNAILLGDRIAPQTTEIKNGELIVNYADRKEEESMVAKPSVGVSRYMIVKNGILVEREGEYY